MYKLQFFEFICIIFQVLRYAFLNEKMKDEEGNPQPTRSRKVIEKAFSCIKISHAVALKII